MLQNNNIILLQQLFDKYIYSSYTEEQLAELDANDRIITSELDWREIYQYFPTKESFYSSLQIYSNTLIQIPQETGFNSYTLVTCFKDMGDIVQLNHAPAALKLYLNRQPSSMIYNSFLLEIFIQTFERYKIRGGVLYTLLSKGYQYSCTPEELKKLLGVNYINSLLNVRVLSPVEKIIRDLFNEGKIPFYFNIETKRSVIGRGSKIIGFQFNTIDNLTLLRQKRMRSSNMRFIMSQLTELFPFDYPFLEEDIKKLDDKTVENINCMIRDIEQDPDYNKITTSMLVKYKLQQKYNVTILNYK